jgi:hypothetical protein
MNEKQVSPLVRRALVLLAIFAAGWYNSLRVSSWLNFFFDLFDVVVHFP